MYSAVAPSASPGLCPPLLYQLPALHCPKWALRPRAVSPVLRPTPRCVSRRAPLEISYTSQSDPRTGLVSLGITPWRFARVAAAAGSASLSKAENRPPCGWTVSCASVGARMEFRLLPASATETSAGSTHAHVFVGTPVFKSCGHTVHPGVELRVTGSFHV